MPDEPQPHLASKYRKSWEAADPLGKYILEKLVENNLTTMDLAYALEIDRHRLPAILNGNSLLTGDELVIVSRLLRVPLYELARRMIKDETDAEVLYLVNLMLHLTPEQRDMIRPTLEKWRSQSLGKAVSSSSLLARRHRRRSPGE